MLLRIRSDGLMNKSIDRPSSINYPLLLAAEPLTSMLPPSHGESSISSRRLPGASLGSRARTSLRDGILGWHCRSSVAAGRHPRIWSWGSAKVASRHFRRGLPSVGRPPLVRGQFRASIFPDRPDLLAGRAIHCAMVRAVVQPFSPCPVPPVPFVYRTPFDTASLSLLPH